MSIVVFNGGGKTDDAKWLIETLIGSSNVVCKIMYSMTRVKNYYGMKTWW